MKALRKKGMMNWFGSWRRDREKRLMEQESERMILFCPDLTGKEEIKAMFIGNGDFVRPVLHPCIKEKW